MTPTARSMKWLRDRGWIVARVEQRLIIPDAPYPITRDAFGFGDLLAAHRLGGIVLIQATDLTSITKRAEKILRDPKVATNAACWLRAGGTIMLHGWGKRGPKDRKRWKLDQRTIIEQPKGYLTEVKLS
jgi:hypothetical protein